MEAVIGFSLGLLIGLLLQGIKITIQKQPEKKEPVEYNQSASMDLPPEHREFLNKNRGWVE